MCSFSELFMRIKNEVLALKTMFIKTATTMVTTSSTYSVSLPLYMTIAAGAIVVSRQQAKFTVKSKDGSNMLATCTLKGATTLNDRIIFAHRNTGSDGIVIFSVYVINGNASDYQTLYNGGSVTVNLNVEITTTSDCDITRTYENINWG